MAISQEQLSIIKHISDMIDLVEYQMYIGRKTKYGDKPGPEPWYHTQKLLETYPSKPSLEEVVNHFQELGVNNEVEAAMFIGINMKHIP